MGDSIIVGMATAGGDAEGLFVTATLGNGVLLLLLLLPNEVGDSVAMMMVASGDDVVGEAVIGALVGILVGVLVGDSVVSRVGSGVCTATGLDVIFTGLNVGLKYVGLPDSTAGSDDGDGAGEATMTVGAGDGLQLRTMLLSGPSLSYEHRDQGIGAPPPSENAVTCCTVLLRRSTAASRYRSVFILVRCSVLVRRLPWVAVAVAAAALAVQVVVIFGAKCGVVPLCPFCVCVCCTVKFLNG